MSVLDQPLLVYINIQAPEVTRSQACRLLPFPTPTARSTSHSAGQTAPPHLVPRFVWISAER